MCEKVVFLDIDGVMYPCIQRRFIYKNTQDIRKLLQQKGVRSDIVSDQDLCAFAYGFDKDAIAYIKQLVSQTDAGIVISSSWRFSHSLACFQTLFSLFDLGTFVVDMIDTKSIIKEEGIEDYLICHPEIKEYVVLDDIDMHHTFGNRSIRCPDVFNEECLYKALEILKSR